ncbi:MAG: inorganic phosphate transporter [Pseudomonadota bacterium]
MELLAQYGDVLVILACAFGLFMAWGIGANDVSNAMGTSVGSKVFTIKQAIIVAMVFEFAGAYFAGGEVTSTIRSGIVDASDFTHMPFDFVLGMLASLLAAAIWLLVASTMGWPVSTTHSIVGAIIGFGLIAGGSQAIHWDQVGEIAISWVVSPVSAAIVAYFLFRSAQRLILDTDDPFRNAKKFIPWYMFAVGFILAMVTMTKGLKHIGLPLSNTEALMLSVAIGALVMALGMFMMRRIEPDPEADREFRYASVEKVFGVLMIFTACSMAFAHGSNDVANAIGPLAAVLGVVQSGGEIAAKSATPQWVLLMGAVGIVIGLATYGYKVIATIGEKITELTPSRGFAAEFAAATTVVIASGMGMPISTTHTLVGAVLGVGLARGIGSLNLGVIGGIFTSWVITLPVGALLSMLIFLILKFLFGA